MNQAKYYKLFTLVCLISAPTQRQLEFASVNWLVTADISQMSCFSEVTLQSDSYLLLPAQPQLLSKTFFLNSAC